MAANEIHRNIMVLFNILAYSLWCNETRVVSHASSLRKQFKSLHFFHDRVQCIDVLICQNNREKKKIYTTQSNNPHPNHPCG
jgi:hypothetical protein